MRSIHVLLIMSLERCIMLEVPDLMYRLQVCLPINISVSIPDASCLSVPVGLVDRTWKVRGKECDVFWEKYVLHFTQPLKKAWIFWPFAVAYIISLAFFARSNYFFTPHDSFIDCTSAYWQRLDECGLNGTKCEPFSAASFEFRCPAGCTEVILRNTRTVGDQELDFVPLVVGGGDNNGTYRGDSFICAAAIHA
jgi:hypothetical protein